MTSGTPCLRWQGLTSGGHATRRVAGRRRKAGPTHPVPAPEFHVISKKTALPLVLAISAALAGVAVQAAPPADDGVVLDTSKLPPVNRFAKADLDPSKDPCTDFGGYVNGKWLAANNIPGDRTSWGAFEMLDERSNAVQRQIAEKTAAKNGATGVEKIVGDFWATGMDVKKVNAQGIAPLKGELAKIAGLDNKAEIADYLRASAAKGENVLFGFGSTPDYKNSSVNIGVAFQGGLGLPDTTFYTDASKAKVLQAYQAHVAKVLTLSGVSAADAAKQAKDVVAFETRLAKASKSRSELSRDAELFYNPVSIADADKLTPNFPWSTFFKSQGIEVPAMFSLAIPSFHQEVSKMLADVPASAWRSYLRYRTVDGASPYLSDAFVNENFDFYSKTLRGQKQIKERAKRVLGALNGAAGEAMGQLYVKAAFSPESKTRMEQLVQNLRDAQKARIENLDWMTPETKQKALAKWAAFTPKIGYPDKWRDWSGLKTTRASYIDNAMAADEFNYKWDISKIGKPVDRTEWGMSPQTVNAYYNPSMNEIVFPAAILQPPFFDPNAPDEMNYGGIGAVIGHEMTHGYDDQGSRFGPTGNFENWWTAADSKGFESRTDKLVNQFNGYEAAPGLKVDGKHTLGENIADLGGLNTAYDAMKKATAGQPDTMQDGLTRDQRFFLNFGTVWRRNFTPDELKLRITTDEHAPATFRAIGAPSNMPAFAKAFQCKAGSPMVRAGDQQVVIW
jgi:putative endopeptidase